MIYTGGCGGWAGGFSSGSGYGTAGTNDRRGGGGGVLICAYNVTFTTSANITGTVGAASSTGTSTTIVLPAPTSNPITESGGSGNGQRGGTGFTNKYITPFTTTNCSSDRG